MEDKIEQLKAQAAEAIKNAAGNLSELDDIRVKFLGKKGEFTTILRGMGALAKEDRPKVGKIVNEAKAEIAALIQQKNEELKAREMQARLEREKIDVTLPGRQQPLGHLHPLTLTLERIKDIFFRMGFSVEEGPEIEKDYYNFEALNLPKDHPARDMQDSFYITEDILMRSQTSPVQARTMQKNEPNAPIRMKYILSREELENKIATFTAGRAAEEVKFGLVSTGASNDIEQATKLARAMITRYGMSDEFDMVAMETVNNRYLGGDTSLTCSAATQQQIDKKVVELVRKQHEKAIALLKAHMDKLDALASYLYEKETITGDEFMKILEGDKSETKEVESAEQKLLADEEKDVKADAEKAKELACLSEPSETPAPAATEDQQEKNQPPQS